MAVEIAEARARRSRCRCRTRAGYAMRSIVIVALASLVACGVTRSTPRASPNGWCTPSEPCWPSAADWDGLRRELDGKLLQPGAPIDSTNPFALEADAASTQSRGWLDAWTRAVSPYAVAATNARDVAAAVKFATAHRLRIVIKGTGHDYLGRSNAPDSRCGGAGRRGHAVDRGISRGQRGARPIRPGRRLHQRGRRRRVLAGWWLR